MRRVGPSDEEAAPYKGPLGREASLRPEVPLVEPTIGENEPYDPPPPPEPYEPASEPYTSPPSTREELMAGGTTQRPFTSRRWRPRRAIAATP